MIQDKIELALHEPDIQFRIQGAPCIIGTCINHSNVKECVSRRIQVFQNWLRVHMTAAARIIWGQMFGTTLWICFFCNALF